MLTLKLIDQLLYFLKVHPNAIKVYKVRKHIQKSSYQYPVWRNNEKQTDRKVIEAYFEARPNWEKTLNLPYIKRIFQMLIEDECEDDTMRRRDYEENNNDNYQENALVINTSLLRMMSEKLIDCDWEILKDHALKTIDAFIRSIRKMTGKIEEDEGDKTILLEIRKTLGSLLEFVKKLTANTKQVFEDDLWFKIINLQSLGEIQTNLPKRFS